MEKVVRLSDVIRLLQRDAKDGDNMTLISDETAEALNALPNVSEWISCKENPPKEGEKVLVQAQDLYYNTGGETGIVIGYRHGRHWETYTAKGCEQIRYPEAWMPLPKRYNAQEHR